MSNSANIDKIAKDVVKRPASDWLPEQYIVYSMYVLQHRALVAEDGLKPVQRRVLWTLFKAGVGPSSIHMKTARAAGNTLAYHPHAPSSVEEAIAKMAQGFNLRVPLIDPHGSVGRVWGDTPASARYWECRLTKPAMELLKELNDGALPLGRNFDGTEDEPSLLPVRWPAGIINGSTGIAVGYAASLVPHNPTEVMKAARKLLRNPEMTTKQLMRVMPGPDFPTGGELHGTEGVKEYFETGRGKFSIRGRYNTEQLSRGRVKITFYELPYGVSAETVRAQIQKAQQENNTLREIAQADDLTDKKNGLKLVITTKAGTNHLTMLQTLFKKTSAETKFSVNSRVLSEGQTIMSSLFDQLHSFLQLRRECIENKLTARIGKIDSRTHQLEALLAALLDIDKAIEIIRGSNSADAARNGLMKTFKIDKEQADYILSMQLRRLTKADSHEIQKEHDELTEEKATVQEIIDDPAKMIDYMDRDLQETEKIIGDKRRTVISGLTTEEAAEQDKMAQKAATLDKNAPCYVVLNTDGAIRKLSKEFAYESKVKAYEHGLVSEQIKMKASDNLVLIGSDGIARRTPLSYVALDSKPLKAENVGVSLPDGVRIVGISKATAMKSDIGLAIGTKNGLVKVSKIDFPNKEEFPVISLDETDEVVSTRWLGRAITNSYFAFGASDSNVLLFPATSIRPSGSKSGGVRGFKTKEGSEVLFFGLVESLSDSSITLLSKTPKSIKHTRLSDIPTKSKGGMGVATHLFRKGESTLVDLYIGKDSRVALSGTLDQTLDSVVTPALSDKRAAAGVPMNFKVELGSGSVTIM